MKEIIEQAIKYAQPIGLIGRQGVGKSTVVKQVVAEQGLPFMEVALERADVEDVFGLPTVVDGRLVRLRTPLVDFLDHESQGVVFFDEALSASPQVLQTIQTMISERYLPEFNLHISKEIVFIIASNDDQVGTFVTKPSQAFSDRFAWYAVEADFDYFIQKYGAAYGRLLMERYEVTNYIHEFVEGMIDLSPRSYERAIVLFQAGATVDFVSGLLPRAIAKRLYDEVNGRTRSEMADVISKDFNDYSVYDWFTVFEAKFIDGKGGKPGLEKIKEFLVGDVTDANQHLLVDALEAMDMVLVIKNTKKARDFRDMLAVTLSSLGRKQPHILGGGVKW
jgi:hypothetical protein